MNDTKNEKVKRYISKWISTRVIADAIFNTFMEAGLEPTKHNIKEYWYQVLSDLNNDAKRYAQNKLEDQEN